MGKIYTGSGDKGETSLGNGLRVPKEHIRVEAYGTIDELNSMLGLIRAEIQHNEIENENSKIETLLREIQMDLMLFGSILAGGLHDPEALPDDKKIVAGIDKFSTELEELNNFILPGGAVIAALTHFARAVCRRAERRIVALAQKESVPVKILAYINRLSDFLFILARYFNHKLRYEEEIWKL